MGQLGMSLNAHSPLSFDFSPNTVTLNFYDKPPQVAFQNRQEHTRHGIPENCKEMGVLEGIDCVSLC